MEARCGNVACVHVKPVTIDTASGMCIEWKKFGTGRVGYPRKEDKDLKYTVRKLIGLFTHTFCLRVATIVVGMDLKHELEEFLIFVEYLKHQRLLVDVSHLRCYKKKSQSASLVCFWYETHILILNA